MWETNATHNVSAGERRPFVSTGIAFALLLLIALIFYHGLWQPGQVLSKRDALLTFLPLKRYLHDRLLSGELPQWFPYDALGRPYIGIAVTGLFHPFTLLYTMLPPADAYRVSVLLSCLLAAGGAFTLGRHFGFSMVGALVSGVAFACSGFIASLTETILSLYSICLLPLFFLTWDKALSRRPGWVAVPAVLWTSVFLNGDIQTGYYYGFAALLWLLCRAARPLRQALLKYILLSGVTLLLAGIQLGPALTVFQQSSRIEGPLFQEFTMGWSTHPLRLLTMVAWPISEQINPAIVAKTFFDTPQGGFWAESLYVGMPVMILAVLGLHRRDLRVLAWLGTVTLWLALGRYGGLYQLLSHLIPFWSAFRYPEKFMGFVSFALAMLAGAGLDRLRQGHGSPIIWIAVSAALAAAGLGLRTDVFQAALTAGFGATPELAGNVASTSAAALFISAAYSFGAGLLTGAARRGWIQPHLLAAGLLMIITIDLASANMRAYFTSPAIVATFMPPLVNSLATQEGPLGPGRFRIVTRLDHQLTWPQTVEERFGFYPAVSIQQRQALNIGINADFGLESVLPNLPGFSPALEALLTIPHDPALYARLNVAYFVRQRSALPQPPTGLRILGEVPDFDLALVANPVAPKPRAYLSRKPERSTEPLEPAALLARKDFLNGEVDVIETVGDSDLPGPAKDGLAVIEQYTPEEVTVRVETLRTATLILADAFDEGWTARLDNGISLPILRANLLMRAVNVPAGRHTIIFSYRTPGLVAGATASAVGILLAFSLFLWSRCGGSRPRPDNQETDVSRPIG